MSQSHITEHQQVAQRVHRIMCKFSRFISKYRGLSIFDALEAISPRAFIALPLPSSPLPTLPRHSVPLPPFLFYSTSHSTRFFVVSFSPSSAKDGVRFKGRIKFWTGTEGSKYF